VEMNRQLCSHSPLYHSPNLWEETQMSHFTPPNVQQIQELLHQRLHGQVLNLRVLFRETQIVLQGVAASYHAKQVAQHVVFNALGTIALVNEIEVQPTARRPRLDAE